LAEIDMEEAVWYISCFAEVLNWRIIWFIKLTETWLLDF